MEHTENIVNNSMKPIILSKQKEITRQMEKCICKISMEGKNGTGFFAKIPFSNIQLKVLITNNHILNADDILDDKIISFSINNNLKNIKIVKERKRYTSEKYDTTIIEIIEELDKIDDVIEYLEIDDANCKSITRNELLQNEHFNILYKNESLYILNILGGKDIAVSYGLLLKIDGNKVYHQCSVEKSSSGAPILSLENNKLIGIHCGLLEQKFNLGTLISYPIIEFQNNKINENNQTPLNSMTIKYKIDRNDIYLRLFGKEFVENNKNKLIIIIEGITEEITEKIKITEKMKDKGYLEILLKEKIQITNMSHMFCRGIDEKDRMLLMNITDITKWDTKNITDMSYLFCCCEELEKLPDISFWNTSKVKDMSNMISYCRKLESLPDISNWDTKSVTNMSHMFANDIELKSFPDISKWNTSKVQDMGHMFAYCEKINDLPDVSKWDTSNIVNMSYMFSFCKNLSHFPNIFKWKIKNPANLKGMFFYCYQSENFKYFDSSQCQINKKCNVDFLFYYCDCFHGSSENNDSFKIISDYFKVGIKSLDVWNI